MLSLLRLLILQQCGKRITVYYYRLKVRRILFTLLFSVLIMTLPEYYTSFDQFFKLV